MKVIEAINEVDALKVNMYTVRQKIIWLNRLDLRIWNEIALTHEWNEDQLDEEGNPPTFDGYTEEDQEAVLLVPEPYAEMYVRWLEAQIDLANMETEAFNASNEVFESLYSEFRNAYNRSHMPKGEEKIYF